MAELIVAKHRSGAVGDVKLRFVNRFARFENWDENANIVNAAFGGGNNDEHGFGGGGFGEGNVEVHRKDSKMNSMIDAGIPFAEPDNKMPDIMPGPGEEPAPF